MFVHSVYFWLKSDLTIQQHTAYVAGVNTLSSVKTVRQCFIGTPAATDRPVIDRSYSYALTLVFDNQADHDAYQIDPIHLAFVEKCGTFWSRVQIYDSEN